MTESTDPRQGYGRYKDDPNWVGCPRARGSESPCVARDGALAMADAGVCVGCGARPTLLLTELRHAAKGYTGAPVIIEGHAADKLQKLVREVTEPPQEFTT